MVGMSTWDGGERDDGTWDGDDEYTAEEELELRDEDESLPWLESADDYEEDDGVDGSRLLMFALLGLAALVAIVGGIWWATNRAPDSAMVADGSTIENPGDFKEKPENPGGAEVAGTGSVAPGVAEGQSSEGRIADGSAAAPSIDTAQSGSNAASATGTASGSNSGSTNSAGQAAASGGVGVQIGAFSTRAKAEQGWKEAGSRYSALSGFKYRIVQGQADIGTVYRLQAVAGSRSAANSLCTKLKSAGGSCQVK